MPTIYQDKLVTRKETFIVKEKGHPIMHAIKPLSEETRKDLQDQLDRKLKEFSRK